MGFYDYRPEKNIVSDVIAKWITDIITIAALAFFLALYLGDRVSVIGNSMSPVVNSNQVVLVDKLTYTLREPERFDVIVYKDEESGSIYLKRIIGMPGEWVQITDSTIYITKVDGEVIILDDKYCTVDKYESGQALEPVKIRDNEYFVMGDNRNLSEDSRFSYVGNVKRDCVLGRAWLIASPFSNIGFID